MLRALLITLLLLAAPAGAARLNPAEREVLFDRLSTCLVGAFQGVTGPGADTASVNHMVNAYFDLGSIAAQKYGGRRFKRATNKAALRAHAAAVLSARIVTGRGVFQAGRIPKFSKKTLKPIRPAGRYLIHGRVSGGHGFVMRVSPGGAHGCRIHGLFLGGVSVSSLLDGRLIEF